ncbi:MAG: hypothetical protein AAF092_15465 [Pseudomonadota bacterium]
MRVIGLLVACLGLAGCAYVIELEDHGFTCFEDTLCLEDIAREPEARALYKEARTFVEARLGPLDDAPVVAFCSTRACFAQFADPAFRGYNFGGPFSLINAHGWEPYIVRHEMIHQWQSQTFGPRRMRLVFPQWYTEGMAYSLSDDPRAVLPHPSVQRYRAQFEAWVAEGNDWRLGPF